MPGTWACSIVIDNAARREGTARWFACPASRGFPAARLWITALLLASACKVVSREEVRVASRLAGPHLVAVDSETILEADTLPLGAYTSFFARDHHGRVYVSDIEHHRIQLFGADGRYMQTIGRAGLGPGEFELPTALAILRDDSILAVADGGRHQLLYFSLPRGAYLGSVPLAAPFVGTQWSERGDTILFATQQPHAPLIARWIWGSDRIGRVGDFPSYEATNVGAFMNHGFPDVVPIDSGYLMTLPTRSGVVVLDRAGRIVRSVLLPASRRRGMSADILTRERDAAKAHQMYLAGSATDGLHRLPSGEYVVVHLDADLIREQQRGRFGNFHLYVSLLSPDLRHGCLDAPVQVSTDVAPFPAFAKDTLFVFSRIVTDADQVRDALYSFVISDSGCDWVPTSVDQQ